MKQLKVTTQFLKHEDLTGKADPFIQRLDRMDEHHKELHTFIEKEFRYSEGKIITQAIAAIEQRLSQQKQASSGTKNAMETLAEQYSQHVNTVSFQEVTVYYEEIERIGTP
ncbi:hypothetical protein SAMN05421736_12417 [Evansella caseinilytica]|uniref:Uncharacterized protein n=1 Tax=Evansella caseinilytica TaxID=1503961 RepID=A0A1H3UP95_9BACI|nr:hypothetical protein [Evansella caseinilytica]SDZ64218.1 hypothetical protein SAMN05421736_12417 [Evansella caseinilytica]